MVLNERQKDIWLKVVCITARLMEGQTFPSDEAKAKYRSELDDQIDRLDHYVIDLLAEKLKVEELYDVKDLNK